MAYLNHAGTSWPKPAPVRAAAAGALADAAGVDARVDAGVDAEVDPGVVVASWDASYERAHRAVAAHFGVEPARLLLTPGGTSALAVGVLDHAWEPGDRVVTTANEHHALRRPLEVLARLRGVEIVTVPRSPDGPVDLDAARRALRGARVRLVAFTHACNVTGELLPLAELVRLAHEHDALALVDAAQTAGWLPLDAVALEVDLLAFAGHKALHAPWGIGGLFVAAHVATTTPEATCAPPARASAPAPCAPMPGPCDVGSVDRAALAGLEAALAWLAEPERADRLAQARARAARIADAARSAGLVVHGCASGAARLPIVALTSPSVATAELGGRLARAGIVASAGLQCAPLAHAALGTAPGGVVRLSVGPQNDDADVERACAALRASRE